MKKKLIKAAFYGTRLRIGRLHSFTLPQDKKTLTFGIK